MLGLPCDASFDVWSFGCILFEMYAGTAQFPAENEEDLLAMIVEGSSAEECNGEGCPERASL